MIVRYVNWKLLSFLFRSVRVILAGGGSVTTPDEIKNNKTYTHVGRDGTYSKRPFTKWHHDVSLLRCKQLILRDHYSNFPALTRINLNLATTIKISWIMSILHALSNNTTPSQCNVWMAFVNQWNEDGSVVLHSSGKIEKKKQAIRHTHNTAILEAIGQISKWSIDNFIWLAVNRFIGIAKQKRNLNRTTDVCGLSEWMKQNKKTLRFFLQIICRSMNALHRKIYVTMHNTMTFFCFCHRFYVEYFMWHPNSVTRLWEDFYIIFECVHAFFFSPSNFGIQWFWIAH